MDACSEVVSVAIPRWFRCRVLRSASTGLHGKGVNRVSVSVSAQGLEMPRKGAGPHHVNRLPLPGFSSRVHSWLHRRASTDKTGHVFRLTRPTLCHCRDRPVMQPASVPVLLALRSLSAPMHAQAPLIRRITTERAIPSHRLQYRALHGAGVRQAGGGQSDSVKDPSHKALNQEESHFEDSVAQEKDKQQRAPWHRECSNTPPVARPRSAGAMTKGEAGSYSNLSTTADRIFRQTPNNAITPNEANHTSYHHGQEYGQEGRGTTSIVGSVIRP